MIYLLFFILIAGFLGIIFMIGWGALEIANAIRWHGGYTEYGAYFTDIVKQIQYLRDEIQSFHDD